MRINTYGDAVEVTAKTIEAITERNTELMAGLAEPARYLSNRAVEDAAEVEVNLHIVHRIATLQAMMNDHGVATGAGAFYHQLVTRYVLDGPNDGWSGNGLRNAVERLKAAADRDLAKAMSSWRYDGQHLGSEGLFAAYQTEKAARDQADREAREAREARLIENLGIEVKDGKSVKTQGVQRGAR